VGGEQHWPVLTFPMYSDTLRDTGSGPVVYAVPASPAAQEFRLHGELVGIRDTELGFAIEKLVRHRYRRGAYEQPPPIVYGSADVSWRVAAVASVYVLATGAIAAACSVFLARRDR